VTARATPYPPPGYAVRIPDPIWSSALETVRAYASRGNEYGHRGSEALVYLAGIVAGKEMVATGLYRLHHAAQGDRVVVTPEESRWLVKTLRARDEKLIGQIHSHRGMSGHSPGDDVGATSFHEGFLSVVVPRFGHGVTLPEHCAVLESRGGEFFELGREQVRRRLRVEPQLVVRAPMHERGKGSWWLRLGKRLRSIGRKRR
jgi:hypothetical protein